MNFVGDISAVSMGTICHSDKIRLSSKRKHLHPKVKISVTVVTDVESNNVLHFSFFSFFFKCFGGYESFLWGY